MLKDKINNKFMLIYVGLMTFFISCNNVYADEQLIDCQGETMQLIREIFGYIKICIPILLIILGSIDFVKAIISSDEQKMKKATKDFVSRLIIGVVIYFIPSLIEFLFGLIGITSCSVS